MSHDQLLPDSSSIFWDDLDILVLLKTQPGNPDHIKLVGNTSWFKSWSSWYGYGFNQTPWADPIPETAPNLPVNHPSPLHPHYLALPPLLPTFASLEQAEWENPGSDTLFLLASPSAHFKGSISGSSSGDSIWGGGKTVWTLSVLFAHTERHAQLGGVGC